MLKVYKCICPLVINVSEMMCCFCWAALLMRCFGLRASIGSSEAYIRDLGMLCGIWLRSFGYHTSTLRDAASSSRFPIWFKASSSTTTIHRYYSVSYNAHALIDFCRRKEDSLLYNELQPHHKISNFLMEVLGSD